MKNHGFHHCKTEFTFLNVYNLNDKTEFPLWIKVETEFLIFRNGKDHFLKRKITVPTLEVQIAILNTEGIASSLCYTFKTYIWQHRIPSSSWMEAGWWHSCMHPSQGIILPPQNWLAISDKCFKSNCVHFYGRKLLNK